MDSDPRTSHAWNFQNHFNTSLWGHIAGHIASHICFEIPTHYKYHQESPPAKIPDQYHALRGHTPHAPHTPHSRSHRLQMRQNRLDLMTAAMVD